jgi:hypothetical protein
VEFDARLRVTLRRRLGGVKAACTQPQFGGSPELLIDC